MDIWIIFKIISLYDVLSYLTACTASLMLDFPIISCRLKDTKIQKHVARILKRIFLHIAIVSRLSLLLRDYGNGGHYNVHESDACRVCKDAFRFTFNL